VIYCNIVTTETKERIMTPVIRIDDEVMGELKRRAVDLGLIFGTPNEVLRGILGLDNEGDDTIFDEFVDIEISNTKYAYIPIRKRHRRFFPGYKVPFILETDTDKVTTHVTSAPKGVPRGDPNGGIYIRRGLLNWFEAHEAQLKNGATLRFQALEQGKRYKLSISS
jgi:hypothetical protein